MNVIEAIKAARKSAKPRKFKQSFDISINITGLDLKRPENRINKEFVLPHGRGKKAQICLISDSMEYENLITSAEMSAMEKDKKAVKAMARKYDFFMSEPSLMVAVGKSLGKYLGPVGKMPSIVPPGANIDNITEQLQRSVRVRIKDSPVIHCIIGTEDMEDSQIEDNINHLINEVKPILPGKGRIKNVYLKLTMGKAAKIDVVL